MQMLCTFNKDAPFSTDCRHAKRGGYNAVSYNCMFDFLEVMGFLNANCPIDIDENNYAHFLQEKDEIDNFGFSGCIFDYGCPFCPCSCKDCIFCCSNRWKRKMDNSAVESIMSMGE